MMGMWFYFAEAAKSAEEGGDLLETLLEANVINLVIIIAVLVYFGRGVLGKMLADRKDGIKTEISTAETQAREAAAMLAEAQQKLAQAQQEIERLRLAAEEAATKTKERILAESEREVERVKSAAVQDLDAERARAVSEIRQAIASQAIERVEARLREGLDSSAQRDLLERSLAQLGS
ncbi:F0F1-type ATP synthase, subunit b [Rubidibacter lacunae KORDI 51-2]|uniref:ATP synthase subunit b n=1 Tax=Rubidibacter lacunae KORDI 51-2 TaxID=582515 RepID=U5DMJ8_9CHRO|nr:F0F1 ATP synthase subunit B [Rubidibacter lacunae]ERN41829.1 F0F1-type ATP synthase, subunit b [Rubidibacter lacunae KORDI 51-2]